MNELKLLIIDGSLGGKKGNTFSIFSSQLKTFKRQNPQVKVTIIHLNEIFITKNKSFNSPNFWKKTLQSHHAYFFLCGTYWDSWSSYLQAFLEVTTALECDSSFFGKPAGALITMHSVGGKEVLSRLQGVLSTQGYLIPPQSSLTISLASELALKYEKMLPKKNYHDDFWSKDELCPILERLICFCNITPKTVTPWEIDRHDPKRLWINL